MSRSLSIVLVSLMFVAVLCSAQDTNFASGPQYLMNYGSPLLLHPITTPSLSLSTPPPSTSLASSEETSGEAIAPASGFRNQAAIDRIYWGAAPPVADTTEQSSQSTVSQTVLNQTQAESTSEIELTSAAPSSSLPASIADTGISAIVTAQSLRDRGYDVPLGEIAARWKANKPRNPRLYTNADIARLHGG